MEILGEGSGSRPMGDWSGRRTALPGQNHLPIGAKRLPGAHGEQLAPFSQRGRLEQLAPMYPSAIDQRQCGGSDKPTRKVFFCNSFLSVMPYPFMG